MNEKGLWMARACQRLAFVIVAAIVVAACGPLADSTQPNAATATDLAVRIAQAPAPTSGQPNALPTAPASAGQPTDQPPAPASSSTPASPSPTPAPQVITIETPSPGTLVGSPVVVTGHTARLPQGGALNYRVVNSAGQQLGAGAVPVGGAPGQPGTFDASLTFAIPQDGGTIRVELSDPSAASAAGTIALAVDAQYQTIMIDTPPPGTQVGSPVVLTGQTTRGPHQGNLSYRVVNSAGQQLGAGTFPVSGAPGAARRFDASLTFDLPINGDTIRIEVSDVNAENGSTDASAAVSLVVAPATQQISFDTPPPGTTVGSPVVITGRTARFPLQGDLNYRIVDDGGRQLGAGTFLVVGQVDQPTTFNTSLTFTLPRDGGTVHLEVFDQNPTDGAIVASSTLDLDVLPQYQAIIFDTPPPGTQVGNPMVITGRTNLYPNRGQLNYRVFDAGGKPIGTGSFPVAGTPGQRASFNAALTFAEPPNGGNIRLEVLDQADNGSTIASAAIDLVVAPPPPQQIVFETPAPGTIVGSPVVITGHTTRYPSNGKLNYRVRDVSGSVIGSGQFDVSGAAGQPTSFNASLTFTEPRGGGTITVEIYDQNPANGAIVATTSLSLYVAPQP